MNTVNLKAIKNCMMAASKDKDRLNLTGIYIEDRDGYRHYAGTNGHILIHAFDELDKNDKLEKPLILRPRSKIGNIKIFDYGQLTIINNESALIESSEIKVVCDIIDEKYPAYQEVLPKCIERAKEFACFNPDYLKIVREVLPGDYNTVPVMADRDSSAMWEGFVDCTGYDVVVMPMRI